MLRTTLAYIYIYGFNDTTQLLSIFGKMNFYIQSHHSMTFLYVCSVFSYWMLGILMKLKSDRFCSSKSVKAYTKTFLF